MAILIQCLKSVVIVVIGLSSSLAAPSAERQTRDHSAVTRITRDVTSTPCFMQDEAAPVDPAEFKVKINDLKLRAQDIMRASTDIKDYLVHGNEDTPLISNVAVVEELDVNYFTDYHHVTITQAKKDSAINNPEDTLQTHAQLLNQTIVHLNTAWRTGVIATADEAAMARNMVKDLQRSVDNALCEIKIALRSRSTDLVQSVMEPTEKFTNMGTTFENELYRVYMTMNDSERLAEFLFKICTSIYESLN